MYAQKLQMYDFKCFGKADIEFVYPSSEYENQPFNNINLILGDNGGGKSSVLRAVALSILAPVLLESGFVPYRLVKRPNGEQSLLKLHGVPDFNDKIKSTASEEVLPENLEMLARIDRRNNSNRDRLHLDSTPNSPIEKLIHDELSPTFFIVGYGATRRVETGDFSPSSARKSRGLRYQRVAGLFEDHLALRPLGSWFKGKSAKSRMKEIKSVFNSALPESIVFDGTTDDDGEFIFTFEGLETPFSALSDGYKAFIGWLADLLGHLNDVCPKEMKLTDVSGIVLVDEIDLHLHPEWQRQVVTLLSTTFPKLQFIMTTHSPLIAASVHHENIFVTRKAEDGSAKLSKLEEKTYGRSIGQLLMSSYFGLETIRPKSFEDTADVLFHEAAKGNGDAALEYLNQLSKMPSDADEMSSHFEKAKSKMLKQKSRS